MTIEELSPAHREEIQIVYLRRHLGRLRREQWSRDFLRDPITRLPRARVYPLKKRQRGA